MFDRICLWSCLVLGFCVLEVFKSQFQFKYLWFVCSYCLFLPGLVLEVCTSLRNCPFLLCCPFYLHTVACNRLLRSFVSLWCQLWLLIFISYFIDLSSLFSSWWVWLKLYQFCLSSQKPTFSFIAFCYCFLCLYYSILHVFFYRRGTFCWTVILLLLHLS